MLKISRFEIEAILPGFALMVAFIVGLAWKAGEIHPAVGFWVILGTFGVNIRAWNNASKKETREIAGIFAVIIAVAAIVAMIQNPA